MEQKHKWAKEIIAWLNGEKIQCFDKQIFIGQNFSEPQDFTLSDFDNEYLIFRISPKTININGHEISEPLRDAPKYDIKYFYSCPSHPDFYKSSYWNGNGYDLHMLKVGFVHLTEEAAIKHAEALLSFTSEEK